MDVQGTWCMPPPDGQGGYSYGWDPWGGWANCNSYVICSGTGSVWQGNSGVLPMGGVYMWNPGGNTSTPPCFTNSCTWWFSQKIKNNDIQYHRYQMFKDNVALCGSSTWMVVAPGGEGIVSASGLCNTNNIKVYVVPDGYVIASCGGGGGTQLIPPGNPTAPPPGNPLTGPSTGGPLGAPPGPGGGPPPITYNGPTNPISWSNPPSFGTNGPIVYATNSIPGYDQGQTLQTGFNALYDAITRGTIALDNDLRQAINAIVGITNGISMGTNSGGGDNGASNAVNALMSSYLAGNANVSNLIYRVGHDTTNQIGQFHSDNTNLLTQSVGYESNMWNVISNALGGTLNTNFPSGIGTNYASASDIAGSNTDLVGFKAGMDSGITHGNTSIGIGSGSAAGTVNIPLQGGFSIDASLMPGEWSGVWALIRSLISWFIAIGFIVEVSRESLKFVGILGAAQTSHIPNIQGTALGFGGNWLGVALSPAVIAAVLTAMGLAIGVLTLWITNNVTGGQGLVAFTNPFQGGYSAAVQMGIDFLCYAIPFEAIFSAAMGLFVFNLTMAKAAAGYMFIMRAIAQ